MIDKKHLSYNATTHLKGSDIESVDFELERLERARDACYAITATLKFIKDNPEKKFTTRRPPFENEDFTKHKFSSYALEDFTRQEGMITNGLLSMIEIIADNLGEIGHGIVLFIEHGLIEQKNEPT